MRDFGTDGAARPVNARMRRMGYPCRERVKSYNSCFTGSGRVRALRPNFGPVMPRAGARVPPDPKFGKAFTLCGIEPPGRT